MEEEPIDTFHTEHPTCPHCGHEHKDAFEWIGDDGEHACDSCGKKFIWSRDISIAFTTELPRP